VATSAALRMPKVPLSATKLLAVCDFMIVVARAGLRVELRRGRRAVERLDAGVRASFRGDLMRLTAWRGAKRVH
jgi:hypothetical protein